jgi:fucose 4-O-acetylase-like acetyltransferase
LLNNRPFLNYIHQFRGFSILLIVGIHTLTSIPWRGNAYAKNIIFSLMNNGTVLFVFIAGFLFFYLSKDKFHYFTYLIKKLKYVMLPYLIISIPGLIDKLYFDNGAHWWMKNGFMDESWWQKIFIMLITGRHSGVLWFMPMIAVFYVLSIVFIKWAKTRSFDFLVPLLVVAGFWTFQFGYYAHIGLSFVHFLPVYLMGMWVAKFKEDIFKYSRHLLWLMAGVYLMISFLEVIGYISLSHLVDLRDQNTLSLAFNVGKLKASVFCIFLLIFFKARETRTSGLLERTGDDSFGIFFLHLYFINVFRLLFKQGYLPIIGLNIATYLLYAAILIVLCLTAIYIIKLIFKNNSRLIIGS